MPIRVDEDGLGGEACICKTRLDVQTRRRATGHHVSKTTCTVHGYCTAYADLTITAV